MGNAEIPFKPSEYIEHDGMFTEIAEIENNPNYIAKTIDLNFDFHKDGESPLSEEKQVQEAIENIKLLQKHLIDSIPEFHLTIGKASWQDSESNGKTLIVFMKKVKEEGGSSIEKIRYHLEELDEFYSKTIELFIETYDKEVGLVPDMFKPSNYVIGKTNTDEHDKLYFVDLYPIFHWTPKGLNNALHNVLEELTIYDYDFSKTMENLKKLETLNN